jgi:hypothetical protein
MPRTGSAVLPLHNGKAPRWLFTRMARLAGVISSAIITEFGQKEFLHRLSDPFWFQSLGCVLAFDWHSSGVTTTVTGAIKEGLRGREGELGLFIAGGKGARSRKAPDEIAEFGEKFSVNPKPIVYASRMSAKVDSAALQDGYQIYHHAIFFSREGDWAVVQQGMNTQARSARRYHWLSEEVKDFVAEPHSAICSELKASRALDMTASLSAEARSSVAGLSRENPDKIIKEIKSLETLVMPERHLVSYSDIEPKRLHQIFVQTYERQPRDFETLLGMRGVGPKTVRALSLVSEIIHGTPLSYRDPARYSFAHGGKDGTPFPVEREVYDKTIDIMARAIGGARLESSEKLSALKRLNTYFGGN